MYTVNSLNSVRRVYFATQMIVERPPLPCTTRTTPDATRQAAHIADPPTSWLAEAPPRLNRPVHPFTPCCCVLPLIPTGRLLTIGGVHSRSQTVCESPLTRLQGHGAGPTRGESPRVQRPPPERQPPRR